MAAWQIRHKNHQHEILHTVDPEDLNFNINLNDPHDINYSISLDHPVVKEENTAEGDFIGAYQTDWILLRNGTPIPGMSGMITSVHLAEGEEKIDIAGKSWLHYLERRIYPYNPLNPTQYRFRAYQTDVALIIHDMLQAVLAMPYSVAIDVSDLTAWTTFNENMKIEFGDTEDILSKIKGMAEGKPGFDFEITWDRKFKLYYPEYSDPTIIEFKMVTNAKPTLTQTDSALSVDWTDNGPEFTHILGLGAGSSPHLGAARGSTEGQQVFRRLDGSVDFGDVPSRAKLNRLTEGALRAGVRPQREVPIDVAPENISANFWDNIVPGVYFVNITDLYGHEVTGTKKLTSIEANITNEGEELVKLHSTLWRAWYSVDDAEVQV
jgi:hypothetical protein